MRLKIAHVTTVHPRTDTRIAVKEAASLAAGLDAEVVLFVQDGLGDVTPDDPNGVRIVDTGPGPRGRIKRAVVGAWQMLRALRAWRPDVMHFHDPELIPIGLVLRLTGVRVVYDVHEDVPRQILAKHYLSAPMARVMSLAATVIEAVAGRAFNGIVAATPVIAARFPQRHTVTIRNFPKLAEFPQLSEGSFAERPPHLVYVGGITQIRGGTTTVDALAQCTTPDIRLKLAGAFAPESYGDTVRTLPGWDRVDFAGWTDREGIVALLGASRGGVVLLHPTVNYLESLPVKMFEYMAAGLPVIASDFPLWRDIIDGAECGVLVDPLDTDAIAQAMDALIRDPARAQTMGQRGRRAVLTRYNWEQEANALLDFYQIYLYVPKRITDL